MHELVVASRDDGVSLKEGLHDAHQRRHDADTDDGPYGKLTG